MTHVMVDLETLGVVPGCMIVSIGAVEFGDTVTGELGQEFYLPINLDTRFGLHESPQTMEWWDHPDRAIAKRVFVDPRRESLDHALNLFNRWLPDDAVVWGNGADFDNPILAAAYYATGIKPGWAPFNGRCYRTVKNLAPEIKLVRDGTHHNALDDAKCQAAHLSLIAQIKGLKLA